MAATKVGAKSKGKSKSKSKKPASKGFGSSKSTAVEASAPAVDPKALLARTERLYAEMEDKARDADEDSMILREFVVCARSAEAFREGGAKALRDW